MVESSLVCMIPCFFSSQPAILLPLQFRPSDEELVINYLNHKVLGNPLIPGIEQFIHTIEKFKQFHPKDIIDGLNEDYFDEEKTEWYFFTERELKYNNGSRPQRIAGNGYWKATGKDDIISYNGRTIGFKKKLDYYEGNSRPGKKTDWKMHEYTTTINDQETSCKNKQSENIVLCRIYINQRITNNKKKREVVSDDHIADEDGGGFQETATSIDISDKKSEQLPSTSRPMTFDDVRDYMEMEDFVSCPNQERDDVVMYGSLTEGRGVVGRSLLHADNNELADDIINNGSWWDVLLQTGFRTTDVERRLKRPLSTTDFDDL